jgi:A/G-specific adenine glycosylase
LCENLGAMLRGRELTSFRNELLQWFRQFQRDLPWRRTKDPYRIWISEIMLQQTRVAAVIPYYERFLERFPDIRSLAEAPLEEVLRLWSGLGYYSRARNLQKAAQRVVALHGGQLPQSEDAVHALAGVGSYTGAAIRSIAFGAQAAVLDGNVARVLARLGAIGGDLRESKRWRSLQMTAGELLDPGAPGNWNQAMMELGATVCTPRAPRCLLCPVAKFCSAKRLGSAESFPEKRKKRDAVRIVLAAAVLQDSRGRTLLLPPPTRPDGKPDAGDVPTLVSGMWHFPTVAAEKDAVTELRSFLAGLFQAREGELDMGRFEPLGKLKHAVTYRNITVLPFRLRLQKLPRVRGVKVILLRDCTALAISNLTRKIARVALAQGKAPAATALPHRPLVANA